MEYLCYASGEHYAKCFDEFKEKAGELAKLREFLSLHLPSVIRTILETRHDSQFNILSVGSGDGTVDLQVLQIVQAELHKDAKIQDIKIFNRAIEPNRHHLSLYKKAIETMPESLKGKTTFDIRAQTFEEYTQTSNRAELATKFDLVHFTQSIYFVDVEQALKHCFEKELYENGHVVVVVEGKDLIITTTLGLEEMTADLEIGEPQVLYAIEVTKVAQRNGWKCELLEQEYEIDVTEVFDESSIQGNLLLDFLTHYVDFRTTADKASVDKVLSVIRDHTIVRDGKRLGKKIDNVLIISKNPI